MKKLTFLFTLSLALLIQTQEVWSQSLKLKDLRNEFYTKSTSNPRQREKLWHSLSEKMSVLKENISEKKLQNNLNILSLASLLLFIENNPEYDQDDSGNYLMSIREQAKTHKMYVEELMKKQNVSDETQLAYANLLFSFLSATQQTTVPSVLLHPMLHFSIVHDHERLRWVAEDLLRKDPSRAEYMIIYGEYHLIKTSHQSISHAYIANRYFDQAQEILEKEKDTTSLFWLYLLKNVLLVRRVQVDLAQEYLEKARQLYPNSFLVALAHEYWQKNKPVL